LQAAGAPRRPWKAWKWNADMSGAEAQFADREIVSVRLLRAPREAVWRAWTEADRLARWWGPEGFSNAFQRFEPRPGGRWEFVMIAPTGAEYPNLSEFVELVPPERIVLHHLGPVHDFLLVATMEQVGELTRLTFRMRFATVAECNESRAYVPAANEQNLDRLEAELARGG
jgi:uncharacterized protein YndB with AHSA1/START domain